MADFEMPATTDPTPERETGAPSTRFHTIFSAGHEIRIVWLLLIFIVISKLLSFVIFNLCELIGIGEQFQSSRLTPGGVGFSHLVVFVATALATIAMARIEHRGFRTYGLPIRLAFQMDFWTGGGLGLLAISTSLGMMFLFHGFSVSGLAIRGQGILLWAIYWGLAFVVVGLAEEFSYRGYLQYTLSRGIGFWPAALALSIGFALAHARNSGESAVGLLSIVLFGLLFCLFLSRRGNLWLAIGFHAGWDWGETFLFGAPDSGLLPTHNLLGTSFSGPGWLTGGRVGPEASIFTPIVLAIVAVFIWRVRPNSGKSTPGNQ